MKRTRKKHSAPLIIVFGVLMSGVAYSASNGIWPSFYGEMFSTKVRLSGMATGTQIGFAIGGFAPVVAAAVQGEGPNAWVPVAPLNSPIGVVASIAAWTARETQHSDARLRVNRRLPTLTPPDSALSDWNNDEIGESRRI